VEPYLHSPDTPSWRGAYLKKAQGNFTLPYLTIHSKHLLLGF